MFQKIKLKFRRLLRIKTRLGVQNIDFEVPLVRGDTGPTIEFELTDADGEPVDLTGKTVGFAIKRFGESVAVNPSASGCSVESASGGIASYNFGSGVLDKAGSYFGDVIVFDELKTTVSRAVRFAVRDNNQ